MTNREELSETLQRMSKDVEQLPASWRDSLQNAIKIRREWHQIIKQYPILKNQHGSERAIQMLAEQYHHSKKYIEKIIYDLNPTQKVGKN